MVFDSDTGSRRYVWHGGAYIDVGPVPMDGEEFQALDVINIWDYADGKPSIALSLSAFELRCERADLEFEAQFTAEEELRIYPELAEAFYNASAEGSADFEAAADKARELDERGEIDSATLDLIERFEAGAQKINRL